MIELLPPCWCCGAEPPPGADWKIVEDRVRGVVVQATYCPECIARAEAQESGQPPPSPELPEIDDITYARRLVGGPLLATYPRLAAQLDAIVRRVELVLTPRSRGPFERIATPKMPEDWAVPTVELVQLVAALLKDQRLAAIATAIGAVIEASFAEAALGAITSDEVSASFGTSRVPSHALRQIEDLGGPRASVKLAELVGGSDAPFPTAGPRIKEHAEKVHVDHFRPPYGLDEDQKDLLAAITGGNKLPRDDRD